MDAAWQSCTVVVDTRSAGKRHGHAVCDDHGAARSGYVFYDDIDDVDAPCDSGTGASGATSYSAYHRRPARGPKPFRRKTSESLLKRLPT